MLVVGVLALAALLIAAGRWMRSDALHLLIFAGFPALLVALAPRLDLQLVTWFKVFALCVGILIVHFAPRLQTGLRRFADPAIYIVLVLNISGPALYDLMEGRWFGGGVAVAIMLLTPRWNAITYPVVNGRAVVAYDISWMWIAAYTMWNASFAAAAYPAHASDHIAVLSAPILLALWAHDRRAWFRGRALTISLYAVMVLAAVDVSNVRWIPALSRPEGVRTFLVAAAWTFVALDVLRRRRTRGSHELSYRAAA